MKTKILIIRLFFIFISILTISEISERIRYNEILAIIYIAPFVMYIPATVGLFICKKWSWNLAILLLSFTILINTAFTFFEGIASKLIIRGFIFIIPLYLIILLYNDDIKNKFHIKDNKLIITKFPIYICTSAVLFSISTGIGGQSIGMAIALSYLFIAKRINKINRTETQPE